MVSAVVTYRGRSAFREVCKAFGVNVGTLSAKKVERHFNELVKNISGSEKLKEKIDYVTNEIHGFPRHLTIHSGGFTLSADPIIHIVPVEPARMEGRTIVQWDKYDLDTLGLLKVDVLSLGMLSALRKTLNLVGMKLHQVPHDDKKTYQMIQQCDTVGTFQIESRAQISMLGRLLPKNFYDLVIEIAIVRPGPIVGKMVHPYLKRRKGIEKTIFPNEKVKAILGKTLGIPLFQEQIMRLARTCVRRNQAYL
jgi:error-prone DNA polymerase